MKMLVCINCPNGCELTIDEITLEITGNKCPKGIEFAKNELTSPMRTICSSVKTIYKDCPVLPCKVNKEIPKDRIFDVMKQINSVCLDHVVKTGDVIISNVCGLNVDVVATSDRLKFIEEK